MPALVNRFDPVLSDPKMPSLAILQNEAARPHAASQRVWSLRSAGFIVLAWLILQFSGIFSPGLLDDVDSIYIQIAREMMQRHDYVTPYIDGIRFFDKPPLMYWMASVSMSVFGASAWAARLPLALAVLALLFGVYALGNRMFSAVSPEGAPDRGGFYSAIAVGTAIGPYLYTRFFIPDILLALWMTLGVHFFLIALERIQRNLDTPHLDSVTWDPSLSRSALLPCIGFAAIMALNILTKGLIGAVFPVGFVLLYLAATHRLHLLPRFHLLPGIAVFLCVAAPWHILVALRNPAIALPAGVGLPAHGGWAWFYLYNEHIARFLSRRIPHDYGQTPVWLFWLYTGIWTMPWAAFLPSAISTQLSVLRNRVAATAREREAALSLMLWGAIILGFFTISARQEYYGLPAVPALCLMAGGLLSRADTAVAGRGQTLVAARNVLKWSVWFLAPLTITIAAVCGSFALLAPHAAPGTTLSDLLANDRSLYNLSLGHIFDLTGPAMGLFRGPLIATTVGMLTIGFGSTFLRWKGRTYPANLTLALGMTMTLLAAHAGLVRFYPILGSKDLAMCINAVIQPDDLVIVDSEVTYGSTLIFYTGHQVHVVDGHFNGLWYGSFWPDSPQVFETDDSLHTLWSQPRRIFLLTYHRADREKDLAQFGSVYTFASSGGKSILTNH